MTEQPEQNGPVTQDWQATAATGDHNRKILTVHDLNLWFGRLHVLKNINIAFEERKVTAIIGPSGCGKSTLLRCFNRMNDFTDSTRITGQVRLEERDIYAPNSDVYALRMKVGMVFQKPNPFAKSIFENVAFGLRIKGIRSRSHITEKVEKSLRDAWLWDEVKDRLYDPALSLSGGQQQRLCIARALATDPEVILLDEPTSALDPQSTSNIEKLLEELKHTVTILIVTHNFSQAARVSDYTAFLYVGELIEYGPTQKLFTVPEDRRTEAYLTGKFG